MGLTLDEPKADEKPEKINGIDVLIDEFAASVAGDSKVEWIESSHGGYLTIIPSSGSSC